MKSNNPLISIIIVSYNNYDNATAPCLQSLLLDRTEFEIIIVDNASDDYTRENLQQLATTDSRIKIQFNTVNRGYAGGNNDGVAMANSDLIILLNNDTLVPNGAVAQFAELLTLHNDWHMLGPMTNENGNEQRICTNSRDIEMILAEGVSWCSHSNDFSFSTDELGFFCVAMQKKVYEDLSGLDESFGLGFYEDTDFCHRAVKTGLNLIITEDIFIYHQGSATFSKLPEQTQKLLQINRRLFQKKHGKKSLIDHPRQKNLRILEMYRTRMNTPQEQRNTLYKACNRLQTAEQLQPNSILKKYGYNKQLRKLQSVFDTCSP